MQRDDLLQTPDQVFLSFGVFMSEAKQQIPMLTDFLDNVCGEQQFRQHQGWFCLDVQQTGFRKKFLVSLKYVSKEVATQIHEKALPFVKWLQEAEEEESSDDDDDSDVEIEYDDRAKTDSLRKEPVKQEVKKTKPIEEEEDGDDLNIDEI